MKLKYDLMRVVKYAKGQARDIPFPTKKFGPLRSLKGLIFFQT